MGSQHSKASASCFDDGDHLLFIGNSEAGKSTLLNSLIACQSHAVDADDIDAQWLFEAGLSNDFSNVTLPRRTVCSDAFSGAVTYCGVPGLSGASRVDVDLIGRAICAALQQVHSCRIAFVFDASRGRIRDCDIATVHVLLAAIDAEVHPAIILNKVSRQDEGAVRSNMISAIARMNNGRNKSLLSVAAVHCVPFCEQMSKRRLQWSSRKRIFLPKHEAERLVEFLVTSTNATTWQPEQIRHVNAKHLDSFKRQDKALKRVLKQVSGQLEQANQHKAALEAGMAGCKQAIQAIAKQREELSRKAKEQQAVFQQKIRAMQDEMRLAKDSSEKMSIGMKLQSVEFGMKMQRVQNVRKDNALKVQQWRTQQKADLFLQATMSVAVLISALLFGL